MPAGGSSCSSEAGRRTVTNSSLRYNNVLDVSGRGYYDVGVKKYFGISYAAEETETRAENTVMARGQDKKRENSDMRCPFCNQDNTRVVDSRPVDENTAIRRRRQCDECGKRFTTYEKVETIPLIVIKKDQNREQFDRSKSRQSSESLS